MAFPELGRKTNVIAITTQPREVKLIPYAWFLALEQPRFTIKRRAPAAGNFLHAGLRLHSRRSQRAESRRSASWLRARCHFVDPYDGQTNIVPHHVRRCLPHRRTVFGGKAIRIDAGPSLIDLQKFTEASASPVTWTYYDPVRFHRFANRVLGPNHSHVDALAPGAQVLPRYQLYRVQRPTSISSPRQKVTAAPTLWLASETSSGLNSTTTRIWWSATAR